MAVAFANAVAARLHLDGRLHAFSQFKYAYLTFNKHRPDRHLLVSSYPQEWLDIYSANRYQRIDPVVRAAHSRCAPFMWHDTPVTTEDRHYRKIFSQAREYDIVHGCSFVLHDHDNNLAILSISATAADDADLRQLMEDERANLQMVLVDTHQHALALASAEASRTDRLSPREGEILYWASQGKTYHEIALILGIKTRTVKFHIGNAVRKLGVTNAKHAIRRCLVGLLPSYETIGIFAPILLALARFGQGLGLGGEWGGAALLATENAPAKKRALYGSFPQLGAPIGFFFANGTFLLLSWLLSDQQFMEWGWRVPFILSAALVLIGLYVRVSLHETPVFAKAAKAGKQVKVPLGTLLSKHLKATILGTFIMLATYTLFYLMTVYSMTYGTAPQPLGLGYSRNSFLWMLMVAVIGFGVMVPIAGLLADAFGRRKTMIAITLLMIGFAFLFPTLLGSGNQALVMGFLLCGLSIMGLTFGPMGALLPELFPTEVRYTGASFSYNVASILGASVAPYIATWLAAHYGLFYVGMYLAAMAGLTLLALLLMKETRHQSL